MAEPIKMPFGLRTLEGPRNCKSDGVQIPHGKRQGCTTDITQSVVLAVAVPFRPLQKLID